MLRNTIKILQFSLEMHSFMLQYTSFTLQHLMKTSESLLFLDIMDFLYLIETIIDALLRLCLQELFL